MYTYSRLNVPVRVWLSLVIAALEPARGHTPAPLPTRPPRRRSLRHRTRRAKRNVRARRVVNAHGLLLPCASKHR